jgi:hypothetical protein
VNHIMFGCMCNRYVWVVIKEVLGWDKCPTLLEDFVCNWLDGALSNNNRTILFGLGVVCWALWKVRNKMTIEKKVIRSPKDVIYNIVLLMQQWEILLPDREQDLVGKISRKLKRKLAWVRSATS